MPRGLALKLSIATLSASFTASLLYLTVEAPLALHRALMGYIPDFGVVDWAEARALLEALRPIGVATLLAVAVMVALGFIAGRMKACISGSILTALPSFSYFAPTMFTLTGLGILRLPLIDVDPLLLKLGHIALIPYMALTALLSPLRGALRSLALIVPRGLLRDMLSSPGGFTGLLFIVAGCSLMGYGVGSMLYGRAIGLRLIDRWAYRWSRHPQYLGFMLWTYGLTVTPLWRLSLIHI